MSTTKATLQILIETSTGSAQAQLSGIAKELEKVDKSGKQSEGGLRNAFDGLKKVGIAAGVAIGTVVAVGAALKKTLDIGAQGAAVTQTAESFDFLSQKLGLAPDLLDQLSSAANGTISDMQLMSSTATLLAGTSDELGSALGNATPRLLEIAKAANKLNPSLGDTAFLYDSIATGVKRASPLILDNLGLTISIGEANERYAESLGKTVEQLSEEEKKLALLNATLEAGDSLIAQVGGNTESATDAYEQLGAEWENLTNTLKASLNPAISDFAGFLGDAVGLAQEAQSAYAENRNELEDTALAAAEAGMSFDEYQESLGFVDSQLRSLNPRQYEQIQLLAQQNLIMERAISVQQEEERQIAALIGRYAYLQEETEELVEDTADLDQTMRGLAFAMRDELGKAADDFAKKSEEIAENIEAIQEEIDDLEEKDYLTAEQEEQLEKLRGELADQETALADLANAHDEATNRILFNLIKQELAVGGFTAEEAKLLGELGVKWGLLSEEAATTFEEITTTLDDWRNGASYQETINALVYMGQVVKGIAGNYDINFTINTSGSLPSLDEDFGPGGTTTIIDDDFSGGGEGTGDRGGNTFGHRGTSGIVPPGFSEALGNPFMIGAETGEGFAVLTREQMRDGQSSTPQPRAAGSTLVFDFRGAIVANEAELERVVERALSKKSLRADAIRRMR